MKPDQLPVCTNEAIQNKLVQAQREMKMLQTSSVQVSSMSSTSFQRVESSSSSSQVSRSHHQVCENSEAKSFASNFNGNYLSSSFSSEGKSDVCNISEVTNSSLTNGHRNGTLSSNDSLENVISKGTETVRALTDAINRDDQRFSLPREDRRSAAKEIPSQNQNNIAGSYFQSKYGANNNTEKTCTTIEQKRVSQINSRARSVGAATPDRESRGPSFSYLSLLPADGSFPHRTQPIGGPQTSRKSSCTLSRAPSIERNERSGSEKPNLMVRTNPIGLAEPSVKRDGYAVGKDGSFYRSSENLFSNPPSRSCSRASSETPEVRTGRRQSDTGIRLGGGLVETGRPVVQHFSTPFGSTVTGKTKNYTVKKGTSSSTSTTRKSEKKISTSTQHINQIKTESSSSMMTSSSMTKHESNMTSSTRSEEVVNCTLNLNRGRHRSQSSTRSTVTTLPDHDVTISLPGSLRASVDRDVVIPDSRLSRANRSSSMEIFNGVYEVKVPLTQTSSKKSKVEEIYTDHVILRGANGSNHAINGEVETSEAPHAEIILTGIPLHRTALVKPDAVRKPREPVNNSVSLMKHNNYATNSMTQNHNTTSQFTQHHNSAFSAVTQKSSTLNTSVIQSNTINTVTKNQNTVSASTQSFNTANAYSQNSKVSSGFTTHSSTAQSTIQNFSTSSTTTESSSVATSLASSKLVLAQEMKMEQIKQEKPELQQIEDKKEFSTKLTNGFALHNVQSNSMSQTGEQKRIEAKIETEKKDEKKRLEQREDIHSSRETIVSGQKFNISSSLKKTSKLSSREDLRETINVTTSSRSAQIGGHLKGLDLALEALAHKQQQEKNQCQQQHTKVTNGDGDVTNVTVSLPASRRTSRRGSVDLTTQPLRRSRRNSIDLFSAEYDIKLSSGRSGVATPLSMEQKNVCHIRIDDRANSSLKLCPRCHGVGHLVENCTEFGNLSCPRCLEWNHWEDSCPSCDAICPSCQSPGHLPIVHSASDYKQRRAVVDTLGWELMRDWFFEAGFRSWWQLNGCVGVPLYKIYPRKNQWRSEGPIIDPGLEGKSVDSNHLDNNCTNVGTLPLEERAAVLAEKYSSTYKVKRDTSIDDLLKSFNESKLKRASAVTEAKTQDNNDDDNDSGRSTPEYLKKYSVNYHFSQKNNNNNSNSTTTANSNDNNNEDSISISNTTNQTDTASKRRLRTFSETLKMLDDDILAELDMK